MATGKPLSFEFVCLASIIVQGAPATSLQALAAAPALWPHPIAPPRSPKKNLSL